MAVETARRAEVRLEELRDRIWWLIRLRWLAAAGVLTTILVAPSLVEVRLEERPLLALTAGLALYNVLLWAIARYHPQITRPAALFTFANLQIAVDWVFLTALLHFAGGIENPFVCTYVFHVVIASILLSQAATYLQASWGIVLVAAMAVLEATGRLPHYPLWLRSGSLAQDPNFVIAVVAAVTVLLYATAFMATAITGRLRQREGEIVRLSVSLQEHADDLERAYASLHRLEQQKSDYLQRAAHHLRSPLAAVENMVAVVVQGRTGEVPPQSQQMLTRARARIHGMLDLARDLLLLSQAREVAPFATPAAVDLEALLRRVVSEFQQEAGAAGVALALAPVEGRCVVSGQEDSLAELAENLISNAVKYTPREGRVDVSLGCGAGRVELRVSDTGIGIPPEEQSQVFDEFYRAGNARTSGAPGTGLGLSIVKAVAEAHGGTVSVESEVGAGTTVRVSLPAGPPRPQPAAARDATTHR
jgi:signal transduction histidine kinase